MIGIIVSGSAVPTAASTEPTAPSASSSLRPNHSMPLVKSSAPSRMMRNATTRTTISTLQTLQSRALAMPMAMTTRIAARRATMRPLSLDGRRRCPRRSPGRSASR